METVQLRSPLSRLAYAVRDRLNAPLFGVIHTHGACVLDVGGGAFHERLRARGHQWQSYAVIEPANALLPAADPLIHRIVGTAERLPFADASFDVVLAIQVLEHVFDPQVASKEMYRVLRPGGELIILAPQSGTLHLVPHHYANLTRFWLFEQARRLGAEVLTWRPIG